MRTYTKNINTLLVIMRLYRDNDLRLNKECDNIDI